MVGANEVLAVVIIASRAGIRFATSASTRFAEGGAKLFGLQGAARSPTVGATRCRFGTYQRFTVTVVTPEGMLVRAAARLGPAEIGTDRLGELDAARVPDVVAAAGLEGTDRGLTVPVCAARGFTRFAARVLGADGRARRGSFGCTGFGPAVRTARRHGRTDGPLTGVVFALRSVVSGAA